MEELIKKIPVSIIALSVAILTVLISIAVIRGDTSIDIWGIKLDPNQTTEQKDFVYGCPVGSIIASYLSPQQMEEKYKDEWILADGSDVSTNTLFFNITGKTKLPDLRGMFIRGLNVNRDDGKEDPDDERAVGDFQEDAFKTHSHKYIDRRWANAKGGDHYDYNQGAGGADWNTKTELAGDSEETRPKNVALYYYIKIN